MRWLFRCEPICTRRGNGSCTCLRSVDANPDAPTQIANGTATTTYGYDNNGNLTSAGTSTFSWDYNNRMTQAVTQNSTSTYAYDFASNRVSQVVGSTTTIYPNKFYSITSATNGATTYSTTTVYVWNGDTLIATIDQAFINGSATGTPATRYIHADHLGSTNIVSDESGNIVADYENYPYGETRLNQQTYPTKEQRQFIGQFKDGNSLSYLNARYLNSQQAQFLSEDPVFLGDPSQQTLQDPQGLNSYSYANDNPVVKKDPTGRQSYEDFVGDAAIEFGDVADKYIDEGVAAVRSSVGVSNTAAQGRVIDLSELPTQESLQTSVGWPTEMPGETSPLTWHTGNGLAVTTPLTAITLLLMGDVKDNLEEYKKGIEAFMGMANAKSSSPGSAFPKGIPHTQTANIPAMIGRPQPQSYISAPHGASSANNSSGGNSSASSGGTSVSTWMGAFNPFIPHSSGH